MVYRYLPQQSPISGGDLGVQQLDHFSLAWAIARHSKVGSSYPNVPSTIVFFIYFIGRLSPKFSL